MTCMKVLLSGTFKAIPFFFMQKHFMVPASQIKRIAAPPGFPLISNHFERFGQLVGKPSSVEVSLCALGDCDSNSHYFTSS